MSSLQAQHTQSEVHIQAATPPRRSRPHLHELDMIRVVTALSVVAVHVLSFTILYNTTQVGVLIQHGVEASLHFTREVFMFTTALVLVYSYRGKRFQLRDFWRKRGVGVVLPYAIWTVIYVLINHPYHTAAQFAGTTAVDLVSGNASFQLYYILLTIQFYLLFPVLLWALPWLNRHLRATLLVSALIEMLLMTFDYHALQTGPLAATALGSWLDQFQNRFVLVYQFYFVLGALCALHLDTLRALAVKQSRLIAATMGGVLAVYWAHYAWAVGIAHENAGYAISVLQPIMVPYSVAVIAFLSWYACRWALRPAANGVPRGSRAWRTVADASFGIYLVHPIFIGAAMNLVIPHLPGFTPEPVRVVLVWALAAGASAALSVALMRLPILSRLVGRATPLPPAATARLAVWRDTLLPRKRRDAGADALTASKAPHRGTGGATDNPAPAAASLAGGRGGE